MALSNVLSVFSILLTISITFCYGQLLKKEAYATVQQLVTGAGYPLEKYLAYTSDGYILQLFRIPGGKGTKSPTRGKKAVVLVHGLLGSADNFLLLGPNRSIAYILADNGYDVWLANLRGNILTSHKTLSRSDPAFWEYSFHEHGKYDAPAFIDKILSVTGLSKIMYVGHSMGCATFYIMTSLRPEYNEKMIAFVGLGPAGYMDHIKAHIYVIVEVLDLLGVLRRRGVNAIAFSKPVLEFLTNSLCTKQQQTDICMRLLFLVVGEDREQQIWDMVSTFIMRLQPASIRQLEHFAKIALTGVFTSYEDGVFGAINPYNLTNIKTPVSLWYGGNDQLTEKNDVIRMAKELNETGTLYTVKEATTWAKFNHLDFLFAKDIVQLLNLPLYEHLEELYNKFGKDWFVFNWELADPDSRSHVPWT